MDRLGLHPSEMMDVMEDGEVWHLDLELLSRYPHGKVGNEEPSAHILRSIPSLS